MKTYSRPHFRQSHTWQRFARILRQVRAYAYTRKEEALRWSLEKCTHGFCVPAVLETLPAHGRGLSYLRRQQAEINFAELEAKSVYLEEADAERVELYVHIPTRRGIEKAPAGYFPDRDAAWMTPLLREHLPLRVYVVGIETECAAPIHDARVTVAIARPDIAARQWIDIWSNRKEARAERWRLEPAVPPAHVKGPHAGAKTGSRVQVVAEPTVDDWIREDIERREMCLSELPAQDYWKVAPRL